MHDLRLSQRWRCRCWAKKPYLLAGRYRCFGGTYLFYLQAGKKTEDQHRCRHFPVFIIFEAECIQQWIVASLNKPCFCRNWMIPKIKQVTDFDKSTDKCLQVLETPCACYWWSTAAQAVQVVSSILVTVRISGELWLLAVRLWPMLKVVDRMPAWQQEEVSTTPWTVRYCASLRKMHEMNAVLGGRFR
jgi:hypothetical protein